MNTTTQLQMEDHLAIKAIAKRMFDEIVELRAEIARLRTELAQAVQPPRTP